MARILMITTALTAALVGALVKADAEKWWPIIKAAGIKAE